MFYSDTQMCVRSRKTQFLLVILDTSFHHRLLGNIYGQSTICDDS